MSNPTIRTDVNVIGEISPLNSDNLGGDVFVIGTIYNNQLFLLLRASSPYIWPGNSSKSNNGVITQQNEYAWHQSGITYYTKEINNVSDDIIPPISGWECDYFKWKYDETNNNIAFYVYQDYQGITPLNISGFVNKPTLKFQISEPAVDLCDLVGNKFDDLKYYFQPSFSVQDGNYTFSNDNQVYTGCINTSRYYDSNGVYDKSVSCSYLDSYGQNGNNTYPKLIYTTDPPGISKSISKETKLWSGITYKLDITSQVYSRRELTEYPENYKGATKLFSQPTYFFADSEIPNSSNFTINEYGGLPAGFKVEMNNFRGNQQNPGNEPGSTFQFYKNGGERVSCFSGSVQTTSATYGIGNDNYFKFLLIPINFFQSGNCENIVSDPIYSYCSSGLKKGDTDKNYYKNFCGNNIETGFTNYGECVLNNGIGPYYYPKFCYNDFGEPFNQDCGNNYNQSVSPRQIKGSGPTRLCSSTITTPNNTLQDIFGQTFDNNSIVYNNITNSGACCYRRPGDEFPTNSNNSNRCSDAQIRYCSENTVDDTNCYWKSIDGTPICKGLDTDPSNCIDQCTEENQENCEIVLCNDNNLPKNCISICEDNDPNGDCYYQIDGQFICKDRVNFPPGCVVACNEILGIVDNCVPFNCDDNDIPGCLTPCTDGKTPETSSCNYYTSSNGGKWICDDNNFPPGCVDGITVPCNDDSYTNPPDCLEKCTDLDVPQGCHYYSDGEWICDEDGFPFGCKKVCESTNNPPNCQVFYCDENNLPPGCVAKCDEDGTPEGCYYFDEKNGKYICKNNFPPGCENLCSPTVSSNCVTILCSDQNIPGCLKPCEPNETPETDECNYYYPNEGGYICNQNYPIGCNDVCENKTDINCLRVTCQNNENYADDPNCWDLITSPVACTGENDPVGCIEKINGKFVCQSINNPVGCVYECINGKAPTWSVINSASPPSCVNKTTPVTPTEPTDNTGIPIWIWVLIGIVVFFLVVFISFFGYREYTKSNESNESKKIEPQNKSKRNNV